MNGAELAAMTTGERIDWLNANRRSLQQQIASLRETARPICDRACSDSPLDQLKAREAKLRQKLTATRRAIRQRQRAERAADALKYADVIAQVKEAGGKLPNPRELAELLLKRRARRRSRPKKAV